MIEIVVAVAILMIVAWQLSDGLSSNMKARTKIELQRQILTVESALKGAAFKKLSTLVESGIDCNLPKVPFLSAWSTQSYREARLTIVDPKDAATAARLPPEMAKRCMLQTHEDKVKRGFYFCVEMRPGTIAAAASGFMTRNDVYAEVFFALWDSRLDRAATCKTFKASTMPVRGAKMFYTLYWRPKAGTGAGKDDRFFRLPGVMYGQTRTP